MTRGAAAVLAFALSATATAAPVTLDNQLPTGADGFLFVNVDDFGSYGVALDPITLNNEDKYRPHNVASLRPITKFAGVFLTIKTDSAVNGLQTSLVVLTEDATKGAVASLVGDGDGNAIRGDHTALSRSVQVSGLATIVNSTTMSKDSLVLIEETDIGLRLDIDVRQTLTYHPETHTTTLDQDYAFRNNSDPAKIPHDKIELVLDVIWDVDFTFDNQSNPSDDIVGVRDVCYVYLRDPMAPDQAVSLGVAGIEPRDPTFNFTFALKQTNSMTPPFTGLGQIFDFGVNSSWLDGVAELGVLNATAPFDAFVGESGTSGNGVIGVQRRDIRYSTGAANEEVRFVFRRTYGTHIVPCRNSGKFCGVLDDTSPPDIDSNLGEQCEAPNGDTPTCNSQTCQLNSCGDGYVNTAAGEECESIDVDTVWCNGAGGQGEGNCKFVPMTPCGDGYANAAIGEPCDSGMTDDAICNGALAVKNDGTGDSVACTPVTCGDHYTNNTAGEECDTGGFDTGECNGKTPGLAASCKRTKCGDGYLNDLLVELGGPGEVCDEGGETATCNGAGAVTIDGEDVSCKPAMCGDGYANAANAEECDGDELCSTDCTYSFQLGGGCGGCASKNSEAGWILGFAVGVFALRRRHYNSRRMRKRKRMGTKEPPRTSE